MNCEFFKLDRKKFKNVNVTIESFVSPLHRIVCGLESVLLSFSNVNENVVCHSMFVGSSSYT